jgi:hypothetical protein
MEAIKLKEKVISGKLVIKNLEKYTGQEIEVIVLVSQRSKTNKNSHSMKGCLSKYANNKLRNREKDVWTLAIKGSVNDR